MKKKIRLLSHKQILICLCVCIILFVLQSCATFSASSSNQSITVNSNLTNFSIYQNNKLIQYTQTNTAIISLKESIEEHTLEIRKKGYESVFFDLQIIIRSAYYANILFLPLSVTASSFDRKNNNVYEYLPKHYYIYLSKSSIESMKYKQKIQRLKKINKLILLTYDNLIVELYYKKGSFYEAFVQLLGIENKEYISKHLNKQKLQNCTDPVKLLHYLKEEFQIK